MSFDNNDVLANLFANAIRSPQPSTSKAASPPAARPSLAHSKSIGAEPSTPRRPQAAGKRLPRRSTASFSSSGTPVHSASHSHHQSRKGGSVSPPSSQSGSSSHHHHSSHRGHSHSGSGSGTPFAGASFTDSPSARAIPLPPTVWFEDDESPCPPSDTESISSFTTTSSSISSSSSDCGAPSSMSRRSSPFVGIRVNPLQLIAAVSAL